MKKLQQLISDHRLIAGEVFHELNELNQIDLSRFSDNHAEDIKQSIDNLEKEYNLRKVFISELETLL